jgi:hypothetical protein
MPHPLKARFRVTYEADFDLWGCRTPEEYIEKVKENPVAMRSMVVEQIFAQEYEAASVEPDSHESVSVEFIRFVDEHELDNSLLAQRLLPAEPPAPPPAYTDQREAYYTRDEG